MFQVGDRVKPKNPNSLFSSGVITGLEEGDWMMVDMDCTPVLYYLAGLPIMGSKVCLVIRNSFENE